MKGDSDISPWHQRQKPAALSIVTFILFGAICTVAGFGLGSYFIDQDSREAIELFGQLSTEKVELNGQVSRLRQQLSILESGSKIDRLSVQQTQKKLAEMQSTQKELEEKLAFYQRIMAPEKANEALYIQSFRLISMPEANRHKFVLTLSQGVGKKRATKGSFSISVSGQLAGEEKKLQLKDLNEEQKNSLPFNFRYFQTITRNLILPDGFVPQSLVVNIKPSRKGDETVEKEWDWKRLAETEY
ncbi:MAG: hypothetical protein DRQ61_01685 [Gammaproteobacteria bacterium]|nr:MAG: hypothetical protein DRQ56_04140 [Gammaproteobacteria bacterium]RLA24215.1 MAG: hypothetical protein DRQ61_01685 [Gammaproteobacteria bacterium]